jgi:hypothetical protein
MARAAGFPSGRDILQHGPRGRVPFRADGTGVGVADGVLAALQLRHGPAYAFEDVQGLESGHDDRDPEALRQFRVLPHPHHAAHVPGRQEALDAAGR